MDEISNGQRAIWTFLITSLAAPFLAALIVFALSVAAGALGRGPESLKALDKAGQIAWAADKAVATFAWSALWGSAAAAFVAGLVFIRGGFGWLEAVVAGAVAVSIGAFVTGGMVAQHITPIAFIGALVGLIMWAILTRGGILRRTG